MLGRKVFFGNGTTVSGSLIDLGNGTSVFNLNVVGAVIDLSANDDVRAFITAPAGRLGLGRQMTFTGVACVNELAGSRKVTIQCAPD